MFSSFAEIDKNIILNADNSVSTERSTIPCRRVNTVFSAESSAEDSDRLAGHLKSGYNRRMN